MFRSTLKGGTPPERGDRAGSAPLREPPYYLLPPATIAIKIIATPSQNSKPPIIIIGIVYPLIL
jgi:hypothetical protein